MRRSSKVQAGQLCLELEAVKSYKIIRNLVLTVSCFLCASLVGVGLIIVQKMTVPMGAHAAFKVRDYMNSGKNGGQGDFGYKQPAAGKNTTQDTFSSPPPLKYNEKMMMSIWGQYNRYSVHNMKSHNDFLHTHKA